MSKDKVVNMENRDNRDFIEKFLSRAPVRESTLTLGGTGPNGSSQIGHLDALGLDTLKQLKTINILSASAFAYFLYSAYLENKLKRDNYLNYDNNTRRLHQASFLRACIHFCRFGLPKKPLFRSENIRETIDMLFEDSFYKRPLSSFSPNLVFWAYCSNQQTNVPISPISHPDMTVWEVTSACVSIEFIHGRYSYLNHQFSDPIFSQNFCELRKRLLRNSSNHLYLNYKKTAVSKNVIFLQNQPIKMPLLDLIADFAMFSANIPNAKIKSTHEAILSMLDNSHSEASQLRSVLAKRKVHPRPPLIANG